MECGETGEINFCPTSTPLHHAAKTNNLEMLNQCFQNGEDINMIANTVPPLYVACMKGHNKIVEALVKWNCDVNAKTIELQQTGLHVAVSKNLPHIVEYLVKHGAVLDKQDMYGSTPIFLAAQYGQVNIAEHLIAYGADVNIPDQKGLSPLAIATLNGGIQMADTLIKNHAKLDLADHNGSTALFHAVKSGQRQICHMLTEAGASVNIANKNKEYPVSTAAMYGNVSILEDLIRSKCDVNVVSSHGTPVFLAVQRQHLKALQILVAAGADVTKVDGTRDPLVEALHQSKANVQVIKELISSGSDVLAKCDCHEVAMHSALSKWNERVISCMLLSDCKVGHIPSDKLDEMKECCQFMYSLLLNGDQPFSLKAEARKTIKSAIGSVYYKEKIKTLGLPTCMESFLHYDDVAKIVFWDY